MAGFKMDDYVDVAERIRNFAERFPEGSLQSDLTRLEDGWLCKARAYRTANDTRPGVGHAFEPVPGKTPYTKDSEAMNAETSAWGRAIVALGFETKKIASAQEVQARQQPAAPTAATARKASTPRAATVPDGKQTVAAPPSKAQLAALLELVAAKGGDVAQTAAGAATAEEQGKLAGWYAKAKEYWEGKPDTAKWEAKIPEKAKAAA